MEELKLIVKPNLGTIEFNFDEMERRLDKKLEEYRGIVVTEDTKDIAKKNVAELRKLKTDSDTIRKAVKKEWNKPLAEFDEKIKKLNAKVDEQVDEINAQLINFEVKRRGKAYELLEEYVKDRNGIKQSKLYALADERSVPRKDILRAKNEMGLKVISKGYGDNTEKYWYKE